jgi:hypothetical protein
MDKKINNQQNILFYMESCKTCCVFINIAQKNQILKYFKLICIDGQTEKYLSQGLKRVPTIIIRNINKQIDGNDCLKWLEGMIKMKSTNSINNFNEMYVPDIGVVTNNIPNMNTNINSNTNSNINVNTNTNIKPIDKQFYVPNNNIKKRDNLVPQISKEVINIKNTLETSNTPTVKQVNQLFGYLDNEMSGLSDSYAYLLIDNPLPKSFLPPDKDLQIYTAPEGDKIDIKKQSIIIKNKELERENEKNMFIKKINEDNVALINNRKI